ncbi:NAD(P)/FAD-dependent oxidoreductase [Halosegnis longus]|uniref:NAD(P)/FAD-dependent oxidoreductase n=1 Tax=Halosegnis longus TaxID=2216012 RepID=UPI00096A2790|nr:MULTISPECIES: FAD-dependent oxidoreductase [Halobacteriales]
MTQDTHDLVIAGSGVAGLSAAVYAARADLDPLVLEGDEPGGQLTLTTDVENYLGFPEGVGGMELIQRGKEQAEQFGAEFQHGSIEAADLDGQPLELSLSTGDTVYTQALIVATGASARWVGAENEGELMGQGLSTCATCDGAFHRGNDVLVVGGGDSAMEEALFLAKFADSVTVVHRREELRASEIMADRARDHDDVQFRWNAELEAIHGSQEEGVTGATLVSHPEGYPREKAESSIGVERETVDVGGVFYAVGHTPNTQFLDGTGVEQDEDGYVFTQTDEAGRPTAQTTVEGVFAAGDVADPRYRQAITSAGTGSMAALDAEEFLETRQNLDESSATAPARPEQSAP